MLLLGFFAGKSHFRTQAQNEFLTPPALPASIAPISRLRAARPSVVRPSDQPEAEYVVKTCADSDPRVLNVDFVWKSS